MLEYDASSPLSKKDIHYNTGWMLSVYTHTRIYNDNIN